MRRKWRKCVSKSWLDVQELDIKAMQEGKATKQVETQKIYVNLYSECVNEESMSVSQRATQNQYFIYLRKGKEEIDMELLEEILNQNNLNKAYKKVVANKGVAGVDNDNSFGFRPNRSCEQAVIRALEYLNDRYEWIVDIDLEKFFDTVNQDKLITIIGKTITDGDIVSLK